MTVTPQVSAPGTDPNHANDSATAVANIATSADLLVSYSYDTVNPVVIRPDQTGNDVFYLYNGGPSTANNAKLHLDIPAGLAYVSGAGNGAGGPVACTPAAARGRRLHLRQPPPEQLLLRLLRRHHHAGGRRWRPDRHCHRVLRRARPRSRQRHRAGDHHRDGRRGRPVRSLGNTRPAPVVGEAHELNISVHNYGPSIARNVVVTDVVPGNWRVDGTTDALRCGVTPNPDGTTTVRCAYGDVADRRNARWSCHPG